MTNPKKAHRVWISDPSDTGFASCYRLDPPIDREWTYAERDTYPNVEFLAIAANYTLEEPPVVWFHALSGPEVYPGEQEWGAPMQSFGDVIYVDPMDPEDYPSREDTITRVLARLGYAAVEES